MYKIGIIGSGNVGKTILFNLITSNFPVDFKILRYKSKNLQDNLYLPLDFLNSISTNNSFTSRIMMIDDYSGFCDCDLILYCAKSSAVTAESSNRFTFLLENSKLAFQIATNLKKVNFKNILLVVSNPVEQLAHVFLTVLKIEPSKVIGVGTHLDSQRLQQEFAAKLQVHYANIPVYFIGEHSTRAVAFTSQINSLFPILEEGVVTKCVSDSLCVPDKIITAKNFTNFGISNSVKMIISKILSNAGEVSLVSCLLENHEYSTTEPLYFSTFTKLSRTGVARIFEANLDQAEKKCAKNLVKKMYESLSYVKSQLKI